MTLTNDEITTRYLRRHLFKRLAFAAAATIAVWMLLVYATAPAHARGLRHHHRAVHHRVATIDANGNSGVIGGRPAGCPTAFCGCGLRKYLGLNDKRLDLAWNWARLFPRTSPHPGAAAVRAHHVMLLVAHVEGSVWTVRDYNGGHHLSYIHERDVRGYVFVEPGGGRLASAF
jgi:hypothetical protein